jgi:hypothetical protein
VKAVLGRHFSLAVFGFAQVAMDVEPLVRLLRHDPVVHGPSHTYLGAMALAAVTLLVGRPVCQRLLDHWVPDGSAGFMDWLRGPRRISWTAALSGSLVGTYSHVLLDSIMHADMQPFWPFAAGNDLLGVLSVRSLHLLCLVSGAAGGVGLVGVYWLFGRREKDG